MNGTQTKIYAHNLPETDGDFYTLGLLIERRLTADEALRAAGCLGYALAKMNGETLGEPVSMVFTPASTYLTFWFDSTKCHRSSYSFEEAFAEAARMIEQGTPVRTTNRAGAGTAGTRLVQGIGPVALTLSLDVDVDAGPRPTPPRVSAAQRALDEAAARLNEAQQAYAQAAIAYAGAGL
ncbi:hypothetical protein [Deinococcus soli (ex Cha et al. 2016)]|uniref:hypothetical protein n=1 Tax=Deinococcus soli (ex Cha et al. 2016) TaxID=1309411 RepID=UPI001668BED1|nr:hypothetical protein [Deinococcus soli (ex Cha et al. 2016)]GGB68750.1 hypothetical protein GCM10008019_26190 [Deinococcus soli (ex Cha et al. 2016)]